MKIKDESLSSLNKKGIYSITSSKGKRYIGNTKKSFLSRMSNHVAKLRTGHHPNTHLQQSWNKNKGDSFTFEILEVIEENELMEIRECYWIAYYDTTNREKGYNINPDPQRSPSLTEVVKDKISSTLKSKYASGEIPLNTGNYKKGIQVWNKGKKYESTDHLKVPKTKTDKLLKKYESHKKKVRSEMLPVAVYKDDSLIGIWNSAIELQEYSLTDENKIPVESRFSAEMRRGKPRKYLASCHINKACKNNIPYKGLLFKYLTRPT